MAKPEVFKGGTFRENLLSYSKARCKRDPRYRRQVRKAIMRRKQAEVAVKKEGELK